MKRMRAYFIHRSCGCTPVLRAEEKALVDWMGHRLWQRFIIERRLLRQVLVFHTPEGRATARHL
eukprot:288654-Alexandrium_andersonii.AAC.1